MRHRIAVGVLVRDGQVLLVHRIPGRRWYPDCWDFVGGHIEAGESAQDAIRRECREEIGVDITALEPIETAFEDPTIEMHGFVVTSWRGEPSNCAPDEHDDLRWFGLDELAGLALADPGAVEVIRRALDRELGTHED